MNSIGYTTIAITVVALIILFIGMCLFIAAFSVVDPTYMAIARNTITSKITEDKVYFEGRHFLGVDKEFIFFPMAWQLIEYTDDESTGSVQYRVKLDSPLDAQTQDGMTMTIELSLYFTIPPQQLINFYLSYGVNYQESIANECKRALKDVCTQFKYEEIFVGRLKLSQAMSVSLNRSLINRRCVLEKLLLRGINFQPSIEEGIETSVTSGQSQIANRYKNQITRIESEIKSLRKDYASQIKQVTAKAEKEATLLVEEAKAYANFVYANSTSYAWAQYQQLTELDTESLLRVQWARTLGSTTDKDQIVLGYDTVGSNFVQKVKNP